MRILPIRPQMDVSEMNLVPQFYNAVLHLRLVNARDVEVESDVHLSPANAHLYNYAAPVPKRIEDGFPSSPLPPALPPSSSSIQPETLRGNRAIESVPRDNPLLPDSHEPGDEEPDLDGIDSEHTIGFQVNLLVGNLSC